MKSAVNDLPDDPAVLKQMILDLKSRDDKIIRDLENKVSLLTEEIAYWRKKMFGRSSEKYSEEDRLLGQLFNEAEMVELEKEIQENKTTEETILVPLKRKKKQGGRKPLPASLRREIILLDLSDEEKQCACGCPMTKIGEETSEKLELEPIKAYVKRYVRPKYACRECEGVASEEEGGAVKTAPVPAQLISKSIATPSLIAFLAVSKFCDSLPFDRLSKMMGRIDVALSSQTMCRWMIVLQPSLQPLLDLLIRQLLSGPVLGIDETTLQVIKEPGKSDR